MSFNIRGAGSETDKINHWNKRKKLNVQIIRNVDPDVIGFQEVQYGNLATYNQYFRDEYHHILGLNMDDGNFNPIFWKKSRLRLDSTGGIWLHPIMRSDTPATQWGAANIRCANWVILQDIETGISLFHINTHLDHIGEQARYEGSRLILQEWKKIGYQLATIITGDFNSGHYLTRNLDFPAPYTGAALELFEEAGFIDTFLKLNKDDPRSNTFHKFRGDTYNPNDSHGQWRIDYILTKGLNPISSHKVKYAQPPLYPSDHYPIVAVLK